jgi:hypothetical protein
MRYVAAAAVLLLAVGCNPRVDEAMQGSGTEHLGDLTGSPDTVVPLGNITGSPAPADTIEFGGAWPGPGGRPDTVPPPGQRPPAGGSSTTPQRPAADAPVP